VALKVLHVIPAIAPRYGGPSAVVLGTCAALRAAGVEALVATTDADGPGRLDVVTGHETIYDGVPAIFFPRNFSEAFKWSFPLGAWLSAHASDFDLVDIHAIFSHSSIEAGRVCRRAAVPYVVRPHGALNPWGLTRKRLQKQALFQLGVNQLLSGARSVLYTSAREQELAERAYRWLPEGTVVPPGVSDALFQPLPVAAAPNGPYVLALSRLAVSKRLDTLIKAFHHLASDERFDRWTLVIAGDGDRSVVASLKDLAAQGPASARIRFAGWVEGNQKRALLAGASLLAAPSHQESFGLSLVEAMAHGVPVVTSGDVDLAGEIERAHAGWVVAGECDLLAATLQDALSNHDELMKRGAAAIEFARQFRWSVTCQRLQARYQNIARSGAAPTAQRATAS
jgi:glycosyltransferase involved in cell wall biosynthesis